METKVVLVPTKTLYPQAKPEKKVKQFPNNPPVSRGYKKVYLEKSNNSPRKETPEKRNSLPKPEAAPVEYTFECEFPKAENYKDFEEVCEKFPHLKDINKKTLQLDGVEDLKCFMMRSNNEDDIHKAIKYGIWTSTIRSNEYLNSAFQECSAKGVPIYFFFSVVRSGQLSAVAQMSTGVQEKHFQFWWEGNKWLNHFGLKWIFIKDIPYKCFDQFTMEDGTSVIRARDCTPIPVQSAKGMLQLFQNYKSRTSIFDAFAFMDIREDRLRSYYKTMQLYQAQVAKRKSSKEGSPQLGPSSSSSPQQTFDPTIKEFESMLDFYEREHVKFQREIEETEKSVSTDTEFWNKFEEWLSEYKMVKKKECEFEEGMEELRNKYSSLSKLTEQQAVQACIASKIQELEKVYNDIRNKFVSTKEKIQELSTKIVKFEGDFGVF